MRRKYCRYCSYCQIIELCGYCCTAKGKALSEDYIKHTNTCKQYVETDMGDIITGRKYKPHTVSHSKKIEGQMDFTDYLGMPYQFDNMTGSMNL